MILKNFSTINPSIVIKPGSTLTTIAPNKTILAKAQISDSFDRIVPIYALSRFLSTLSLFENPDLDFGNDLVRIYDGKKSTPYHYSDPTVIQAPPEKDIKLPSVDVECRITNGDIQSVIKAMGILGLPELAIVGDGSKLFLQAIDAKNPSADIHSIEVGESGREFRAIFRSENIKIVDGDYDVKISSKGISQFIGTDVTYWIAIEQNSSF